MDFYMDFYMDAFKWTFVKATIALTVDSYFVCLQLVASRPGMNQFGPALPS